MKQTSRAPIATFSMTNWKSTSIFLVCAWNTRIVVKYIAPRLSHHKTCGLGWQTPNSLSRDCTRVASVVPFAKDLYSAFVLDRDTIGCWHEFHEIIFGPRNTKKISSRPEIVYTFDPFSICKHTQKCRLRCLNIQSSIGRSLYVSQYMFDSFPVDISWLGQILTDFVYCKSNIRPY